jgi:nucleotide-binding universal stress UspA family protein
MESTFPPEVRLWAKLNERWFRQEGSRHPDQDAARRRSSGSAAKKEAIMKSFRRILFATDLSEASRQAFEGAIELSKDNGAELLIAHAYRPSSLLPTDVYLVPAVYEELDTKLRENAQKKLATLAEEARRSGVQARWLVLFGAPDEAIAEAAIESAADLVIVGTHARVGVARFFLGSVASRVIATAPCPVLTVRAA